MVVSTNVEDQNLYDRVDLKSPILTVDCCDEEKIGNKSNTSHCQIDCGLVGKVTRNRTPLQIRDIGFALGNFTVSNEPEIPLRPPIA